MHTTPGEHLAAFPSLKHVGQGVVKGSKVPVMVQHSTPQDTLHCSRHKAHHCCVPNGRVLCLTLCMHLLPHISLMAHSKA